MPRPYPISVVIDGHPCRGTWTLRQGGVVCVGSAWGGDRAEIGSARPEMEAQRILEQIVRADQVRRAAEQAQLERNMAQLRRPRKPKRPSDDQVSA